MTRSLFLLICGTVIGCVPCTKVLLETTPLPNASVLTKNNTASSDSLVPYDRPPELIGGYDVIKKLLKYPEGARKSCLEAKVLVQLVVNELGYVEHAEPLTDDKGWGFNDAALTALKQTKWIPATQNGKPSKCRISVPIYFKLK